MIQILNIREHADWMEQASDYFSSKWKIKKEIYIESMSDSIQTSNPVPRWYIMIKNNDIIGGFGLIENDFMVRDDIFPWLCALYVEKEERGKELGSKLLEYGRKAALGLGFKTIYLNTNHIGYYEKYGWHYIGNFKHKCGEKVRVYSADAIHG